MALGRFIDQELIEAGDQIQLAVFAAGDPQILGDELQKLDLGKTGVQDKGGLDIFVDLVEEDPAEDGLSRSDFPCHAHNPFAVFDPVKKMGVGLFVAGAFKIKRRVGCDVKGVLFESVEGFVHGCDYSMVKGQREKVKS